MKKTILPFALILLAAACSPVVKTTVLTSDLQTLGYSDPIVVIGQDQATPADGVLIGKIRAGDQGFSVGCSYPEMIDRIKMKAQSIGANVIKIRRQKAPDRWSTCERLSADLYRVDDVHPFETDITWTASRKLEWKDFKRPENEFPAAANERTAAETNCVLLSQSIRKGLFSARVVVTAVFHTKDSWVRADGQKNEVLEHEQAHFDLCELYARKMRRAFQDAGKDAALIFEVVTNRYFMEYSKRQDLYDLETEHGMDAEAQQRWLISIQSELDELKAYELQSYDGLTAHR